MKKVLAIVLALALTFSMAVAGFAAAEVAEGQVYFGAEENIVYANPGETVSVNIRLAGNPFESDNYPTDGYVALPFGVSSNMEAPILGVNLTEEAKNAGAVVYYDENSMYHTMSVSEDVFMGTIVVPASFISGDMVIATLDLAVSADWEVIDYVATTPVPVAFFVGENHLSAFFFTDAEAEAIVNGEMILDEVDQSTLVNNLFADDCNIEAFPYQPTFWEILTEQLKGLAAALLDVLGIGIGLLKGELEPADWYDPLVHEAVDLSFVTDAIGALVGMIM